MARRGTSPNGFKVERRKTSRYLVSIPIEASWRSADGAVVTEQAIAKQVNANGGQLEMHVYPDVGGRISLTNCLSAEGAEARVLAVPSSREGVSRGIVVELITPNETFWGVNLQVKKTSIELQKLEKALRSEGMDLRLLSEFRDTVDYIRTAAMAVQQLREYQLNGRDEEEVLAVLVGERIRRATNLCADLTADLESGRVTTDTKGVEELYKCLEQSCDRLRHVVKSREPQRYVTSRK